MTLERRLIQDETPGSMSHALLQAGRDASPLPGSKQRLLEVVLPSATLPGGEAALLKSTTGKGILGALKLASASKLTALSVVAAAISGIFYASQQEDGVEVVSNHSESRGGAVTEATPVLGTKAAAHDRAGASDRVPAGASMRAAALDAGADVDGSLVHIASGSAPAASRVRSSLTGPLARPSLTPAPSGLRPSVQPTASVAGERDRPRVLSDRGESVPRDVSGIEVTQHSLQDTKLGLELRQLDAVRVALRDGKSAVARRLLTDYATRFPGGYLEPEARMLRAQISAVASE